MKKISILLTALLLLIAATVYAGQQSATSDGDRRVWFIAPVSIETIAANTTIDADYIAFKPIADVQVYFNGASSVTFTAYAGEIFILPKSSTAAIAVETKCLMY